MKKSRVFLCGILITLLLTAQAAAFTDTDGHWAAASIERWSDSGLINGYADGTFAPDAALTRGEMAAILCRLSGWQEQAENLFDDVEPQAWYTEYVLKANAAGAMLGDGSRMRPTDPMTRQEAAVMLYRVLCLEEQENTPVFPDSAQIADWAAAQVGTMAAMGYINGMEDGTFRPLAYITRAQVVTILDRAVPALYSRAGAFSQNSAGTVIVSAPGVTLQNMKIEGDLILTPSAAGSETILYNVQVSGRLIVQGKKLQIIHLTGESSVNQIWAAGAKTLLEADQSAQVGSLLVTASGARITGIPVGTPVKAAENIGEVFVNGQSFLAGAAAPAPAGSDLSVWIDIDVEFDYGNQLEQPEVIARSGDSVTVCVRQGLKYVLTNAAGEEVSSFAAETDGTYTFDALSWGHYYLTAEGLGYKSSEPLSVYISDGSLIVDWSESK